MRKLYDDWTLRNFVQMDNASADLTTYGTDYSRCQFRFAEPGVVDGTIDAYTSRTMTVALMNMDLQKDIVVDINDGIERLGYTCLSQGQIDSPSIYDANHRKMKHSKHMLVYSKNAKVAYHKQPGSIQLFNIDFKPAFFEDLFTSDELIASVVRRDEAYDYSAALELGKQNGNAYCQLIDAIKRNPFHGITRQLFIEAKAIELFSLQLNEISSTKNKTVRNTLPPADIEKLHAVHAYLEVHFAGDFSLQSLSRQFGLNEFKLKNGYRTLFDTTVFGHIYQLRMQHAKDLLLQGKHTVAEVAYSCGYTSPNNFATAFARLYGIAPKKFSLSA